MRLLVMGTHFALTVCAVSAISLTVTKARVFQAVRAWVEDRSSWWGDLLSCPYCFSHWAAGALVAFTATGLLDWFVTTMATVALAGIVMGLVYRSLAALHKTEEE